MHTGTVFKLSPLVVLLQARAHPCNTSLAHREGNFNPWRRISKENPDQIRDDDVVSKLEKRDTRFQMFSIYQQNNHLDIYTKRAALTASPSVVGLEYHSRKGATLQCSGFIVESDSTHSVILTSACLLNCSEPQNCKADIKITVHICDGRSFDGEIEAQDFLYNLAAVRIHTDALLPTISLVQLKDGLAVNPLLQVNEESDHRHAHPSSFELIPGDSVIALGRFILNNGIMAAPGVFSVEQCEYKCEELFMASCRITECGIGGPLINRFGEAIGICLHADSYTAFLPINIASTWWEHCKKYRLCVVLLLNLQG